MSGMRDNLGEWAQGHGAHVAETVADHEKGVRAAIAKRRRTRGVATVATAAATIVGVVALASALPGVNDAPPADRLPRHLSELVCGDPWVVEPGTTSYVSQPEFYFSEPHGDWVLTDDNGDTHTEYSGFTAGLGSVSWQGDIDLHHAIVRARVVAVKFGTIVGVTEDQYARIADERGAGLNANAPRPGVCGDTTAGSSSGKVTYHLVLQVQRVGDDGGTIATLVDPGGPKTVAIDGVEEWLKTQAAPPADPLAPQGDVFQAFLVRRPTEASCRPYQDLIAAGNPRSNALKYNVTIPGVRAVSSDLWSDEPVAVITDGNYRAWYLGLPTAVASAEFGEGNPLQSLSWVTGPAGTTTVPAGALGLIHHTNGDAQITDVSAGCVYTLPGPTPSGTVYLIIDGVGWDSFRAQNPGVDVASTSGWQTWVYLGQADNTPDPDYSLGLP